MFLLYYLEEPTHSVDIVCPDIDIDLCFNDLREYVDKENKLNRSVKEEKLEQDIIDYDI